MFTRGTTVTAERYFDLWASLEAEFARPDLAVQVASTLAVEAFDPPLFSGLCSANLPEAAERIAVHKRLIGPMELVDDENRDRLRLEIRWIDTSPAPDTLVEAELLFWVAFARAGTRSTLHPRSLSMPRPPTSSAAFADFVGGARLVPSPRPKSSSTPSTPADPSRRATPRCGGSSSPPCDGRSTSSTPP